MRPSPARGPRLRTLSTFQERNAITMRAVVTRVASASVTIDGTVSILGDRSFVGRFAVGEVEATCREGVEARIRWDAMWEGAQDILFCRAGEFLSLGVERMLYITENLQSFGLRLEDGTIIATDEHYVPLLMSGYYYSVLPVFSNQF